MMSLSKTHPATWGLNFTRSFFLSLGILTLLALSGCSSITTRTGVEPLSIDRVFFAQQHVLEPAHPYFKLVSDLDALVKVQVYSKSGAAAPVVVAILERDSAKKELRLKGPSVLPPPYTGEPDMIPHRFEDSFTGIIPADWVKPGLNVSIELRKYDYETAPLKAGIVVLAKKPIGTLKVGAPNRVKMTMFDFHFFGKHMGNDYPEGWLEELESKLPVSKIDLQRVRGINLAPFVMFPRNDKPAISTNSPEEYEQKVGVAFDGEQGVSLQMLGALQKASGYDRFFTHHVGTIAGVHSGGQAGGFFGVANLNRPGVLIHELGHSFGLPHWGTRKNCPYPFKGPMYGVPAGKPDTPHVGPFWAFDLKRMEFITPITQKNLAIPSRRTPGQWKLDPMRGGGTGDQANYYIFRHFSPYSVYRMRDFTEQRNLKLNEESGTYAKWDPTTNTYSIPVKPKGPDRSVKHEVRVISFLVTLSGVTPAANHIYDPIGPYTSGLPRLYDATNPDDRKAAEAAGITDARCNVCLRVTRGGKASTLLLSNFVDRKADPLDQGSFQISALNLPADGGNITKVELLYTPSVISKGLGDQPEILTTMKK